MKIDMEAIQKNKAEETKGPGYATMQTQKTAKAETTGAGRGIFVDFSGQNAGIGAYGREKEDFADQLEKAAQTDASLTQDYMLVCANTMSAEDYQKMTREGVKPGKIEPAESVTIMDHIKEVMARSGTVIEGFNAEGNLDPEKLAELTGSAADAARITRALEKRDLPVEEQTVKDMAEQLASLDRIDAMTDGMKQYLLENKMAPTPDNLYLARFSATGQMAGGGGYFADDLAGYVGKNAGENEIEALGSQADKVIEEAGLTVDEDSRNLCAFLLRGDLTLTPENILSLQNLEKITFPPDHEKVIEYMADAVAQGKQAKDADLSGTGTYSEAARIKEEVEAVSEEALESVLSSGASFTIRSLSYAQRQIELSNYKVASGNQIRESEAFAQAQNVLSRVRLSMSISANRRLLELGYSIEDMELPLLAEDLESMEQTADRTWNLAPADPEQAALLTETMTKREELFSMPAALLGGIKDDFGKLSLTGIHEMGKPLQETLKKAGESYETLMTQPRADLGDKITDAFSNIDELLKAQGLPETEDNRRAVRILAYNKMEVNTENVEAVRLADSTVTGLLKKMNPAATLQMIRDGVNPLEESVEELDAYFERQELTVEETGEQMGRFLYHLEQTGGISKEEKDAFIGIYRLLHQIKKGDGRAIGAVVGSKSELTMSNLLTAARTINSGGIEATVDDSFGGMNGSLENSISEQIFGYYQKKAAELTKNVTPQFLSEMGEDLSYTLDELFDAQVIEETKTAEEYAKEMASEMRSAYKAPEDAISLLLESGLTASADNLQAAEKMIHSRGEAFRMLRKLSGERNRKEEDTAEDLLDEMLALPLSHMEDAKDLQSAYDSFTGQAGRLLEESMMAGEGSRLDIKAMTLCSKQLSLMNSMSKKESYEIPAVIDGQLTAVSVSFQKGDAAKAGAQIRIELSEKRLIQVSFRIKDDVLSGIIGTNDKDLSESLRDKTEEFKGKYLAKTGKRSDISIIYSENLTPGIEPARGGSEGSPKELYSASGLLIESLRSIN
ncbi:MAG: DUF6240 domain-containing protein [Lachnospiraceae bacterium]|nr:DUF6240 domain-containing protein [Lachnospiraceae bacterium]